jgi:transposase
MLSITSAVRIFLWTAPVDMRKGFDGLQALVRAAGMDVFSGHLFVFVSRRADRAKILSWERGGFVLWYKRLSKGTFGVRRDGDAASVEVLDPGQLAMLLDGVDYKRVRRSKRWEPKLRRKDAA